MTRQTPGPRSAAVFAFLEELIATLPTPVSHRELLREHLQVGRAQAATGYELPACELPLLVHAGVTGSDDPAVPLAGACLCVYLGADLLDNLADDELPARWRRWTPAEAQLSAATFLAALAQLALSRLRTAGVPPERLAALGGLLAETLLTMSAGQHEDLRPPPRPSSASCRAVAERKSGAEFALFAAAPALLAGAPPALVGHYREFGRCLGAAHQLASDLHDIWGGDASHDLRNGTQTLPVVHALASLPDGGQARLRRLLDTARHSAGAQDEARRLLAAAGSLRFTALVIEVYRQKALACLAAASPREPAAARLRRLLDETSPLSALRDRLDAHRGS